MITFHLDQHIDYAIARGLRLRGIDVTTTAEARLQDASDEQHVAYALESKRVIFTQDADFIRIHSRGELHAGIVYCKQGTRSIGEIVQFLELLSQCADHTEMMGRLEFA